MIESITLLAFAAALAVAHKFSGRTTYHGKRVNYGVWYALKAAEKMLRTKHFGGEKSWITLYQGSYSNGSLSAGTHTGSGAFDSSEWNWKNRVLVLRILGFAAWRRTRAQGPWINHIHAIMAGDGGAAAGAKRQVTAFWNGKNGLASNRADDGPKMYGARPLFVFPLKSTGKPGKRYCTTACHAYTRQTTKAPRYGGEIAVGDVLEVVAVTRDAKTGKLWSVTADGRCIYEDNFSRSAA